MFAVGDEQFQRKCFGKIAEFKNRGGTIIFVSHDAQAVERLCDRAVLLRQGEVAFDGSTQEAIAAYRRLLAGDANPEELEAGLREWGSGEARIVSATLVDADGDERSQFAAGEPATVRLRIAAQRRCRCAARDDRVARRRWARARSRSHATPRASAGTTGAGEQELRFQLERLPLADGRFHLRVALTDPVSGELLHTLEDGIRFFVFPAGAETGAVLLDGDWSLQETAADAPIGRP